MAVTMRDVAKAAGVSPASVSFALRGDPRIKQETARHIIDVANRMNYSVNITAKSLRSGRTGVIEAAVFQLDRPFYAQLLAGVSNAAFDRGIQAVAQQISTGKVGHEKSILEKVANKFCDGVILSAGGLSDAEIIELSGGKPVVLLDDQSYQRPFDSVFTPCENGAEAAVTHLFEIGCERVGLVGTDFMPADQARRSMHVGDRRLIGCHRAFERHERTLTKADTIQLFDWDTDDAYRAVSRRIEEGGFPFDGLFCLTDAIAFGALRALREHGIGVPDDVAVIGFDGVREGSYSAPTLSTIAVDIDKLAREAVDILCERIEEGRYGAPAMPKHVTVGYEVLVRESSNRTR